METAGQSTRLGACGHDRTLWYSLPRDHRCSFYRRLDVAVIEGGKRWHPCPWAPHRHRWVSTSGRTSSALPRSSRPVAGSCSPTTVGWPCPSARSSTARSSTPRPSPAPCANSGASAGFRVKDVAIGVSNQKVVVRLIDLPYMERDELAGRHPVPGAGLHPDPGRGRDPRLPDHRRLHDALRRAHDGSAARRGAARHGQPTPSRRSRARARSSPTST